MYRPFGMLELFAYVQQHASHFGVRNMSKMIVKGHKTGERFRDDRYGTVWELVAPAASPCKSFGFAFVEVDPSRESPAHYHLRTEELYYIVGGSGIATVDGKETTVEPGDSVIIPLGIVHKIKASSGGLSFVCVTVPPYDIHDDIEV